MVEPKTDTTQDATRRVWTFGIAGGTPAPRALGTNLFEKDLIRTGRWRHPQDKFTLDVDSKRLRTWVETFSRMRAAGVSVPVPYGHSYDARDNAGFLEALRVEGDRLVGVIRAPRDEDAARIGTTATEVSISLTPDFIDGKGVHFGEAIEHVAITNYPVVPGQGNFEKIAADAAGGRVEIVSLTQEDEGMEKDTKDRPPDGQPAGGAESPEKIALARVEGEKTQLARENQELREKLRLAREHDVDAEIAGLLAEGKILASDENKADIKALMMADESGGGAIQLSAKVGAAEATGGVAETFKRFMSRLPKGCIVQLGRKTPADDTKPGAGEANPTAEAKKNLDAAGIKAKE